MQIMLARDLSALYDTDHTDHEQGSDLSCVYDLKYAFSCEIGSFPPRTSLHAVCATSIARAYGGMYALMKDIEYRLVII